MIDYRSIIVDAIVILTRSHEMKNITFINSIPVFVVDISKLSNSCRVNFILISRRVCENHIFHPFVIILTAYITVNPFTIIGAFCSKRNISHNHQSYLATMAFSAIIWAFIAIAFHMAIDSFFKLSTTTP